MRRERHRPLSPNSSDRCLAFTIEITDTPQHRRQLDLDSPCLLGVSRRPQFGPQLLDVALECEGLREHHRLRCLKDDVGGRV